MNDLAVNARLGLQQAWANIILFVPKLLMFAAILVIGYFIAKFLCKMFNGLLERVGFDRLVERGGIKKALDRSRWDASDIVGRIVYYFVLLFTLQLAFGVFGPNPVSDLLTSIISYLPNVLAAALIIIVAAAIAAGAKQLIEAAIGGLSYGRGLAVAASVAIWMVGIFAALNQLAIAPAIVNGLFYALLAIVAGSAIVAVGGGGIAPMRGQWERVMARVEQEAPRLKAEAQGAKGRAEGKVEQWKEQAQQAARPAPPAAPPMVVTPPASTPAPGATGEHHEEHHEEIPEVPRFRVPPGRPPAG